MIASLTAARQRVTALLGRLSMYRFVQLALVLLAVIALALSLFGLVVPTPAELLVTAAVLAVVSVLADTGMQRLLRLPLRAESSLITAAILLFVLRPTLEPIGLVGIAIAAVAASVSKYLLVWRGRHIFNPAAVGATVVTVISALLPLDSGIGGSAWWVGSPVLFGPVLLLGIAVLWRTEKLRVVGLFLLVAIVVNIIRVVVQFGQSGLEFDAPTVIGQILTASPFLFLGAFMLSEPLTLPPRRSQQLVVATVVGVLAGWPIAIGYMTLGQERALLIGNLVAFLFCLRAAVRLTLVERTSPSPTVRELTFRTARPLAFQAGQYLELDVPHRRADAKGTRRPFSIVSAPEDLPTVRVAYRDGVGAQSTYKRALAEVGPGSTLAVTGVWGDFALPRDSARPLLLVAAGIGVTPFVSHLRHLAATGDRRDIVLVYVATDSSQIVFRDDIAASGVPVVVFTRDEPTALPAGWVWGGPERLDAAALARVVPDLENRHAYISGPPALIADLTPALQKARGITTDAFSGY
ncbi:flavodoxin reductase [Microbacterium sp. cx-55]|uniref:FAD-dependent oxidoreductase n=1 Tax=unclassified Microbacterium TaxID=2609290 RepID=UPI001CBC5829|nr:MULTISPECIES: FAD-dependent oxidoreductase [unclassified Microbacterium]MBZ4485801.1 flavodoxin reductase [Microbacterium sp. cx-55]MCC4906763.1 flavodoxin reductase [Microbacterium sp. cx-59]UGB34315.1 flavodoxin reductase [Microbacterium sp. cx-55]